MLYNEQAIHDHIEIARRCRGVFGGGGGRINTSLLLYRNANDMINNFIKDPYFRNTTPFGQCRDTQSDHGQLHFFGYVRRSGSCSIVRRRRRRGLVQ